jgi:hypothetical protein
MTDIGCHVSLSPVLWLLLGLLVWRFVLPQWTRTLPVRALTSVLFGLIFWAADRSTVERRFEHWKVFLTVLKVCPHCVDRAAGELAAMPSTAEAYRRFRTWEDAAETEADLHWPQKPKP